MIKYIIAFFILITYASNCYAGTITDKLIEFVESSRAELSSSDFKKVHNSAIKGDILDAARLSRHYRKKKDYKTANKWLAIARYRIVKYHKSETREYYEKRIKQVAGDFPNLKPTQSYIGSQIHNGPLTMSLTGQHLINGTDGHPKDKVTACYWLEAASYSRLPQANFLLYQMLIDKPELHYHAYNFLEDSARDSYAPAEKEVAEVLLKQNDNLEDTFLWFTLAQKHGAEVTEQIKALEQKIPEQKRRIIIGGYNHFGIKIASIESIKYNSIADICELLYNPKDLIN
ncbi:MAG: hypothetical protein GY804_04360 [Alphaproteobacteria bacterium]|nr:hypothetical protein [Alphaproteobacteria bacterium]